MNFKNTLVANAAQQNSKIDSYRLIRMDTLYQREKAMANYSPLPTLFEPRAKAVNVKGVANRAVATVLTAGLIVIAAHVAAGGTAAPSTDNGDSVQGVVL